jgi:hypothetical protein
LSANEEKDSPSVYEFTASDEADLRGRRKALTAALNAHDKEALKAFLDPSFAAKNKHGKVSRSY